MITKDAELTERLRALSRRGGEARFADLAPGDWDRVHVFGEGVTRERVERTLGSPVPMDEFFMTSGHLLAFQRGAQVRRIVLSTLANLTTGSYSADAVLRVDAPLRPAIIRVVEP